MKVYCSVSNDARENLALEETLLNSGAGPVLLLYENAPAVVVGRFQNPWRECRTGLARRLGIPILRRISGGGTVVHTFGNLNWSIISPSPLSEKAGTINKMRQGLRALGLEVMTNSRHDLLLPFPGKSVSPKISGSAFRQTSRGSLHHATLLINASLHLLRLLLRVPPRDISGMSVGSIRSEVANLHELAPGLSLDEVKASISHAWTGEYALNSIEPKKFSDNPDYIRAYERIVSPQWIWGKTPFFTERFADIPGCQAGVLTCEVKFGSIHRIMLDGTDWPLLNGRSYHGEAILAGLEQRLTGPVRKDASPSWLEHFAALVDSDDYPVRSSWDQIFTPVFRHQPAPK